jgi:Fe-S-cluster-containing dehydrogenase component
MPKRYGMVIDLDICAGCHSCTIACKSENGIAPNAQDVPGTTGFSRGNPRWNWVFTIGPDGNWPNLQMHYLPVLCNHCDEPACADVCPVGATQKQANGIVTVDANKCIGCRYCQVACPYGVRVFVTTNTAEYFPGKGLTPYEKAVYPAHVPGTVEKCNFCHERLLQGKEPACVKTCPAKALTFGDLDDVNSAIHKVVTANGAKGLKPEAGTQPNVLYYGG